MTVAVHNVNGANGADALSLWSTGALSRPMSESSAA
jgi:hypothetical protein